ncbi:Uncharacterized protein Adt_30906 [Abeliophyllum distichum]|uniref:Uncharacterized protein n=1 Tax=Abeliophyllum distichum TaxID=126358 RepID=A0ABD1RCK1_9LAMI
MINEPQPSKLYPRRSKNTMGLNNMINEAPLSNFQFMPTPEIVPSPIPENITKTIDLNNMIEDLEQMQQQENARRKEKAKQQRMAISSHHIVRTRTINRYATQ